MTTLVLNKTEQKSRLVKALLGNVASPRDVMVELPGGQKIHIRAKSALGVPFHMKSGRLRRNYVHKIKRTIKTEAEVCEREWAINHFGETNTPAIR
jgi:hypothetical protein